MSSKKFTTVEEYITSFPNDIQTILRLIQKTIREVIPLAEEIISYQIPAFRLDGDNIIYYSAWKKHASLYPLTASMEKLIPEVKDFVTSGKGTIQFPFNKPLPVDLIKQIVIIRLGEVKEKNSQ